MMDKVFAYMILGFIFCVTAGIFAGLIHAVIDSVRAEMRVRGNRNRHRTAREKAQRLVDAARLSGGIVE